jgi:ribonuclease HII
MILGIDEVGRGPWAGPLVVGAVVLGGVSIDGLADSKKLTRKVREVLDVEIRQKAQCVGLGWVEAIEIDELGLSAALQLATRRAVEQIDVAYNEIIIDGIVNYLKETNKGQYVTTLKKADSLIPSVSAASIVAKVARDNYMILQDKVYPGYGFEQHVGYGTAAHIAAIDKLGITPLHRLSFAPLAKYRDDAGSSGLSFVPKHLQPECDKALGPLSLPVRSRFSQKQSRADIVQPTTKQIGDLAEDIAAKYLMKFGHKILDRNWKNKFCEIDIVSRKKDVIYFTEVKYRKKPDQGDGLAVITAKKLRQMKFAAEFYVLSNQLLDVNLRLSAISLGGQPTKVETFLEV